jgi:preprotein translocase subunit YajC
MTGDGRVRHTDEGMLSPMVAPMVLNLVPMASSGGGGGLAILLPLVLIVGMIWFMSRSQRRQRQRQSDTVARLQPGTRVITTSGQVGVVDEVEDEYVVLEIAPDVFSRFVKQAIGRVLDDPSTALGEPAGGAGTAAGGTAAGTGHDTPAQDAHEPVANDDAEDVQDRKDGAAGKPSLPPTHTES